MAVGETYDTEMMNVPAVDSREHNAAEDSVLTRGIAQFWNRAAEPLIEHIYGPITEYNHTLGVIAVNSTLTLPRIAERHFGNKYLESVERGDKKGAWLAIGAKVALKGSDGLDGPVARGTHTTTEGGAGFDPFVDMLGIYDDARVIKALAKKDGDHITVALLNARLGVDAAVIAIGGIAHPIATKFAQSRGVEISAKEQPKAVASAKIKFALTAVADASLQASYLTENKSRKNVLKRTGQGLLAVSIVAGGASIIQYGKATASKLRRAFSQPQPVPAE